MCCGAGGFRSRARLTPRSRSVYSAAMPPRTPAGLASLPPLAPAGRELLEVLWSAPGPRSTRQIHDAVATSFPHRAGRKIQTTATLLTALVAQGWVAGEKRGGSRWGVPGSGHAGRRPAATRSAGGPGVLWAVAACGRIGLAH